MKSKIKPVTLLLLSFVWFLLLAPSANAQSNSSIRITGYGSGRTRFVLADVNGGPPPGAFFATMSSLYNQLKSQNNFGPNGVVQCSIVGLNTLKNYVNSGSLVDQDGRLHADVFFGPAIDTNLSEEEAEELAKFVKSGGVLYLSGEGWNDSTPGRGPEYNLLFEKIGLEDRFNVDNFWPGGAILSMFPQESIITKDGPFGDVMPMKHASFRQFDNKSLSEIVSSEGSEGLVFESRIGKGYLAVAGTSLFVNGLGGSNLDYFNNLFALGCDKSWQDNSVILDVPSLKQGLPEYDGIDPVWENYEYDHGNSLALTDCDRNGNGATMAECACALTSASMVMNYHGVTKSPDNFFSQNPANLNFYANETLPDGETIKGFSGGNFNWHYAENFSSAAASNNNNKKVELISRENYSIDRVRELIDNKKPVILKTNSKWGIHWVVVKGYEPSTNRLIINDPASADPTAGRYSYLDEKYTPAAGSSMVVYGPTSSDFRRFQFTTTSQNQLLVTDSFGNKTGYDQESGGVVNNIPNSEYILDEYYGDATNAEEALPATEGVYFLTIKLPSDGEYRLQIVSQDGQLHPVTVYSSDTEGELAGMTVSTEDPREDYTITFIEETAGQNISITKIVEEIETKIDIEPLVKNNIIIPLKWLPVPVAILASDSFDVNKIDRTSLTFGRTGEEKSLLSCANKLIDLNRDRKKDLLCYFQGDKTTLDVSDTEAILKGKYERDTVFWGKDNVKVLKPWFLF